MAFVAAKFGKLSTGIAKLYMYDSGTDTIETVKTDDYFASADCIYDLAVGDIILVNGASNVSVFLKVTKVVKTTGAFEVDTVLVQGSTYAS